MKTKKLTEKDQEEKLREIKELDHIENMFSLFQEMDKETFVKIVRENRNKLMISRAISTHSFDVPNNCYKEITMEQCLADFFSEWQHADYLCATIFHNGIRTNRYFKKKSDIFLGDHQS